ncbi:hypothetical protein SLA2020_508330 [Shorea laevis]
MPWLCGQNALLTWLERENYGSVDNLTLTLSTPNFSVLSRIQYAKALILLSLRRLQDHCPRPGGPPSKVSIKLPPIRISPFFFLNAHGMTWQKFCLGELDLTDRKDLKLNLGPKWPQKKE